MSRRQPANPRARLTRAAAAAAVAAPASTAWTHPTAALLLTAAELLPLPVLVLVTLTGGGPYERALRLLRLLLDRPEPPAPPAITTSVHQSGPTP